MAKSKSKMDLKRIICSIVTILMGGLMIGAYFIPVLYQEATILGVTSSAGFSCANIITNGSSDGVWMAIAVLGLISMILGCMLVLGAIVSMFVNVKYQDLVMVCIAVLVALLAIVMMIMTFTTLGGDVVVTKLGFGVFAFLLAGVVSVLSTMMQKQK